MWVYFFFFFFQAEDGIRDFHVTGVQTCALPISGTAPGACFAGPLSPRPPPFAPPAPPRLAPPRTAPQRGAPLCSPASQLLWRSATSRVRASSATAPRLPDADRPSHATPDGQTRDIPGSDAILLRVMWPSTPAGRQCLA